MQQEAVAEVLEAQAVVPVECDVPIGWSIDEYRSVRSLAREVVDVPEPRWWRRLSRGSRRGRSDAVL
jgi:hypothetical protein